MSTVLLLHCLGGLGRFNGPAAAEAAPLQRWPAADRSIFVSIFTTQWMSHGRPRRIHTKLSRPFLYLHELKGGRGEESGKLRFYEAALYTIKPELRSSRQRLYAQVCSEASTNLMPQVTSVVQMRFFFVAVSLAFPTWTDKSVYTAIRQEFSHRGCSSPVVPSHSCCCWRCWLSGHHVDWLTSWAEQ